MNSYESAMGTLWILFASCICVFVAAAINAVITEAGDNDFIDWVLNRPLTLFRIMMCVIMICLVIGSLPAVALYVIWCGLIKLLDLIFNTPFTGPR